MMDDSSPHLERRLSSFHKRRLSGSSEERRVMTERWKPVVGYEGRYEVSDLGRVRSIIDEHGRHRILILALKKHRDGHHCIGLRAAPEKRRWFMVYRLVLCAFVGPCPQGQEGCHENDVKADDRLSNLRWDTPSGNMLDRVRNGIRQGAMKGVGHHNARLDEDDVRCIRAEPHFRGVSTMLAGAFGVGARHIRDVRNGISWRHI